MRVRNAHQVRRFNISIPPDLLAEMDTAARNNYCSRSEFIRESIRQRLDADRHLESATLNPQSYFNMIKRNHFINRTRRQWYKIKFKDFNWED